MFAAETTAGRWLNVEMQISAYGGILERLVYYACSMYVDQLTVGGNYSFANPAISICLLGHPLFRDTEQAHHRFQMLDTASGRVLENAIEVHTVELTKYNLDEATIATRPKLEQWVFLLLHAQDYDSDDAESSVTWHRIQTGDSDD
jgi:predicted transposase/invertase (TIGR01784 family)